MPDRSRPAPVPWTDKLQHAFAPKALRRGARLFAEGRVALLEARPGHIEAMVGGTGIQQVRVDEQPDGIRASCGCVSFRRGTTGCEHLWAVLLAADAAALDEGAEADASWTPDAAPAVSASGRKPVPRRGARPEPALDWRHRVSEAKHLEEARHTPVFDLARLDDQLIYVLDAAESAARGELRVELALRSPTAKGGWSKPRARRLPLERLRDWPHPEDAPLLAMLAGGVSDERPAWDSSEVRVAPQFSVADALGPLLLPRLCATGRCFLTRSRHSELTPLEWDGRGAWEFRLRVREAGAVHVVEGELCREGETRTLEAPVFVSPQLVIFEEGAAPLDTGGAWHWLVSLGAHGPLEVPSGELEEAVTALLDGRSRPRVDLPEGLRRPEQRPEPVPRLQVEAPRAAGPGERLPCRLSFDYGGLAVTPGTVGWALFPREPPRIVVRDPEAEASAAARLRALGVRTLRSGGAGPGVLEVSPRHLPELVRALVGEGWRVEAEGVRYRRPGSIRFGVRSGTDWFELEGGAEFDGEEVPLPAVLAALRRGRRFVALGDGTMGLVPEEWLERYGLLAQLGEEKQKRLRFRKSQVGLLDALLAAQPEASTDAAFDAARERLRSFEALQPLDPPAGFRGTLRGYQREGLGWLRFLEELGFGGCLADDMGLGKTVQVLAHLAARRARLGGDAPPALVVAPKSLVFNWRDEAARFTPGLSVHEHTGVSRRRDAAAWKGSDLVLTTYGTLRRDALLFREARFDYLVLDEAQAVKNAASASAKAVRLPQAQHRLALSGTPIENHLGELWNLMDFLMPGMLGRSAAFQKAVAGDAGDRALLGRALRPFVLRRTKQQVATDLPPRTEQTLWCELGGPQRRLYEEIRDHYRHSVLGKVEQQGLARSKLHVLEALLRMRQAACHAGLLDPEQAAAPGAKIAALLPQLGEVLEEGHKALVFSQFTSLLGLLRPHLDERLVRYEVLDGGTRDRAARVRRFQEDPECRVFLVSLKAGGLGLNLTAAEYVFLLDPWWNPAAEAQAIDRAHRVGQARPVFAYRIIARDTVEEKVLALQRDKRALADAILGGGEGGLRGLTRDDLEALFS